MRRTAREARRLRLATEILLAYLHVRRAMRRAPLASVLVELRKPPRRRGQSSLVEARDLGVAVARTLALVPGDTRCLARSLVLGALLARRGIPATLVIGAHAAPSFRAHAWVEHAGQPVLSPGDGTFGRLVEL